MTSAPVAVVGGSVASLVAADALAGAGASVDLFLPERGIGGGFTPLQVEGRVLELGTRLIELSYDDAAGREAPPLARYRPGPHGHRPYLALVDGLVRGLAGDDLVQVAAPQVSVDLKRCTDYVLAGDLSGLGDVLAADELAAMALEADECVRREGPHGLFAEARAAELWTRTFAEVGMAHAGRRFHARLIESLGDKILDGGTASVVAALHRKIWMPLFHPITAWEACTGSLSYVPDRPFWSVRDGGMGAIVTRLLERVRATPAVRVIESGPLTGLAAGRRAGQVELSFGDGSPLVADRPLIGVGTAELFGAAGVAAEPLDRVVSTMVWLDVPERDVVDLPTVLCSTEPDVTVFRVTENVSDRRAGFRTLCCELERRCVEPDAWQGQATDGLVRLGVLRAGSRTEQITGASRPSFPVPSLGNRARFAAARERFDALGLPAVVMAGPAGFGADTFNEQVVQGLAAAEQARATR